MSSCSLCDAIDACKKKIKKLNLAANAMNSYGSSLEKIDDNINILIESVNVAYDSANKGEFIGILSRMDDDLHNAREGFLADVEKEISQLRKELKNLEDEDADYHASLDNTSTTTNNT